MPTNIKVSGWLIFFCTLIVCITIEECVNKDKKEEQEPLTRQIKAIDNAYPYNDKESQDKKTKLISELISRYQPPTNQFLEVEKSTK